jgi:histidyl-tRNA synthetase
MFLKAYEVPYSVDPLIVRGLDYYTRTVFEFTSTSDKLALNGGGRYDGLAEILGGQSTPGIGFGAGIERIIQEMKRQGITPPVEPQPRVFVAYFDRTLEVKDAAVQLVSQLRHAEIKAEMSYGDRSPKAQMKRANGSGAAYAVLLKGEELAEGLVTVKDLQAGGTDNESKQVQVKREELIAYLQKQA